MQYICLKLSCKAKSLANEIRTSHPTTEKGEKQTVTSPMVAAVADVLDPLQLLLSWLTRMPFDADPVFRSFRRTLVDVGIELATNANRDRFAER